MESRNSNDEKLLEQARKGGLGFNLIGWRGLSSYLIVKKCKE